MTRGTQGRDAEWQLKKSTAPTVVVAEGITPSRETSSPRIRCPHCAWQPDRSSTWVCLSGPGPEPPFESCGTAWNTFDTGGRCPGCSHQWQWTTCLQCHEWSPHLEWYGDSEAEQ
jgi:hypothetical protein